MSVHSAEGECGYGEGEGGSHYGSHGDLSAHTTKATVPECWQAPPSRLAPPPAAGVRPSVSPYLSPSDVTPWPHRLHGHEPTSAQ